MQLEGTGPERQFFLLQAAGKTAEKRSGISGVNLMCVLPSGYVDVLAGASEVAKGNPRCGTKHKDVAPKKTLEILPRNSCCYCDTVIS
jgi:hypothetical protein